MTYQDAQNILQIKVSIYDVKDLKKIYHTMARQYHSDLNDLKSDTMMKLINNAYSWLKDNLPLFVDETKTQQESTITDELSTAIDAIKHLHDINIELMGCWLWVTGDTRTHKDIFKANGFRWSPKKASWYFSPKTDNKHFYKGKKSLDEIRSHYGSKTISKQYRTAIA